MAMLYDHVLASFDTEIKPTGKVDVRMESPGSFAGIPLPPRPVPHPQMTKHHHELHLIINGPSGSDVSNCVKTSVTAPLLAALIAAYDANKVGLDAAEGALMAPLQACLGQGFVIDFKDEDTWPVWYI